MMTQMMLMTVFMMTAVCVEDAYVTDNTNNINNNNNYKTFCYVALDNNEDHDVDIDGVDDHDVDNDGEIDEYKFG